MTAISIRRQTPTLLPLKNSINVILVAKEKYSILESGLMAIILSGMSRTRGLTRKKRPETDLSQE